MSERGSFVTEWMYCDRCFQCVKEVLGQSEKHLTGIAIPWPHQRSHSFSRAPNKKRLTTTLKRV